METVKTLDNDEVDLIRPRRTENPDNVKRVEFILSEENFDDLFPRRHSSYTYTRLLQVSRNVVMVGCIVPCLQAIGKFPAICGYQGSETKSDDICRRTLATMFAHFAQETGGKYPTIDKVGVHSNTYRTRNLSKQPDHVETHVLRDHTLNQSSNGYS